MTSWSYVGLMVLAGALIAFQSPINAALARGVGVFEASLVSFAVGTVAAVVVVTALGKGDLGTVLGVPRWQLLGGLLGLTYVTLIIVSVPRIGVTVVMVTGLLGQLVTAMLIDHFGWFGLAVRPVGVPRLAGVVLLFVALYLINWRR
ncbi:MAG: DMT family transporter [Myxococcaceae bacterium]|nr:DMT family transporter [Myxococcaceae bacterium]MCI0670022.1 DMT family transporter [Myxococcaceae bacterium]